MNWRDDTRRVLREVMHEREQQVGRYGHNEELLDGTGPDEPWLGAVSELPAARVEEWFREDYERHERAAGAPTWMHLIREEVAEVFREDDPARLREEIIQVAALCVSWVEKLDRR